MTVERQGYIFTMDERLVLAIWALTAVGGITLVVLAARPQGGRLPMRLGAPGGVVAVHAGLAVAGLAGWTALVLSNGTEDEPPWMIPAGAAVAAAVVGASLFWRAHKSDLAQEPHPVEPALERPPNLLRYGHGILGVVTALTAVWFALS